MHDQAQDEYDEEDFDLAILAGHTRRYGPSAGEIETWPRWKQVLIWLTPRDHRWRYSVNADLVRDFGIDKRP